MIIKISFSFGAVFPEINYFRAFTIKLYVVRKPCIQVKTISLLTHVSFK